jgi:hypothetical protein
MGNVEVKDSGSLQDRPAIQRLLDLAKNPFKGVLIFGRGKERKSFIFDEGKPHFPNAVVSEAVLGKSLFEKNLMTVDQFKKVKEIEATGKTFFQSLTDSQMISKDKLFSAVLDQWLDDLAVVFSWDTGQFASVESLPKEMTKVDIPQPLYHYFFKALVLKNRRVKSKIPATARFEIEADQKLGFTTDDIVLNDLEKKVFDKFKQSKLIKGVASEIGSTEALVAPIILALRDIGLARADVDSKKKAQAIPTIPASVNEEFTKSDESNLFVKLKKMDEMDFFEILEVKRDITPAQLQTVYFTLAKKYHPDRLKARVSIPTKDAERFFARITEAYNTLSNAQLRKEYEFKTSKEASAHEAMMKKIVESERVYLDGKALLNKNMFPEAIEKIRQAIELYDQEPEHYVSLAWATFRQAAKEGKNAKIPEAKKMLVEAYNKEYFMSDVSYYLGMISKHEGKLDQAAGYFRKCISVDSNHALAMSELRFVEKKLAEQPGKKK